MPLLGFFGKAKEEIKVEIIAPFDQENEKDTSNPENARHSQRHDKGRLLQNPNRKIVVIEDFDHIPGVSRPTIDGNHVQVTANRLSLTGWRLPNQQSSRRPSKQLRESLEPEQSPSEIIKALNSRGSTDTVAEAIEDAAFNTNIYVSEDSIWTLDPNEPALEGSSNRHGGHRRIFHVFHALSCLVGLMLLGCVYMWAFHYGDEILKNPVHLKKVKDKKKKALIILSWEYYNIHALIMLNLVYVLQGQNIILFRIFPNSSQHKLKFIHAGIGFLGAIAGLTAIGFSVQGHRIKDADSFLSLHGAVGLLTLVAFELQFLSGFIIFMLPWTSFNFRALFFSTHKFFGGIVFFCTITAVLTGTITITNIFIPVKVHATFPSKSIVLNVQGILAIIFGILITYLVSDRHFRRKALAETAMEKDMDQQNSVWASGHSNIGQNTDA